MAKRTSRAQLDAADLVADQLPQVLPPEAEERLVQGLRRIRQAVQLIDQREQCGEDCQHLREMAAELERQINTLRQVYFPRGGKKR